MIAILENTDYAIEAEFMVDEDGNRMIFKTYDDADMWLNDNAVMGNTYQKWADCTHPED